MLRPISMTNVTKDPGKIIQCDPKVQAIVSRAAPTNLQFPLVHVGWQWSEPQVYQSCPCDFRVSSFPCPKVPRIGKMHVILVALGGVVKCDGTFKLETSSTWEFVVGLKPWWPNPFWGSWDSQWFSAGFPVGDRRFWPLLRLHLNFSCTLRFWTSDDAKGDDD